MRENPPCASCGWSMEKDGKEVDSASWIIAKFKCPACASFMIFHNKKRKDTDGK